MKRLDPFSPLLMLLSLSLIEVFIPALYYITIEPWNYTDTYITILSVDSVLKSLYYFLVFIISFYTAYKLINPGRLSIELNFNPSSVQPIYSSVILAIFLAITTLILMLNPAFLNMENRMELMKGGWGQLTFASISLLQASFFIFVYVSLYWYRQSGKSFYLFCVVLITAACVLFLWQLGGRGRAFGLILYSIIIWHYTVKPFPLLIGVTVLPVAYIFAIVLDYTLNYHQLHDISIIEYMFGFKHGRQIDAFANFAMIIEAHNRELFHLHHGSAFIEDIARDLGYGGLIRDSRDVFMLEVMRMPYYLAGYPPSRPGEFYMAFGPIGVVLGGVVCGSISRLAYDLFVKNLAFGSASLAVYISIIFGFFLVQQGSYMINSFVMGCFSVVCTILIAMFLFGARWVVRPQNIKGT